MVHGPWALASCFRRARCVTVEEKYGLRHGVWAY